MTLCIAALCTENKADDFIGIPRAVCCFDAEVQTDVARAETGFKFAFLTERWVAMMSGANHLAKELLDLYRNQLERQDVFESSAEAIEELRKPPRELRRRQAEHLIQSKFAIGYEDFLLHGRGWLGEEVHRQTLYDVSAQFSPLAENVEVILIGTRNLRDLCLYKFSSGELIECDDFAVIGSGAMIAEPVLYQRELQRHSVISKAAYAVYVRLATIFGPFRQFNLAHPK